MKKLFSLFNEAKNCHNQTIGAAYLNKQTIRTCFYSHK